MDGLLARLLRAQTKLGTFLDPLADKLLLLSGYLGLLFVDRLPYRLPLWMTVAIVFRDILIMTGLILIFLVRKTLSAQPHFVGKTATFFQMICLLSILCQWPQAAVFAWVTAFFTVLSLMIYIRRDFSVLIGAKS